MIWHFARTLMAAVLLGGTMLAWPSHPRAAGDRAIHRMKRSTHSLVVTAKPPATKRVTVNGMDYSISVTPAVGDPYGPEPEPLLPIGGPFADSRDVNWPVSCFSFIEDNSGYDDSFDEFNSLLDPGGNPISPENKHHWREAPYLSSSDQWSLVNPVEGTYTCSTDFYANGVDLGIYTAQFSLSYVNPTGEETADPNQVGHWGDPGWQTAFVFASYLTVPGGVNLAGRTLQESDGGNASDTCHYGGSPIDEWTGVPILPTPISSNGYTDQVGWSEHGVACYRGQGPGCNVIPPLPCGIAGNQIMSINVPGSDYHQYKTNALNAFIWTDKVFSTRDNRETSRLW
jgi:hypothetical protein